MPASALAYIPGEIWTIEIRKLGATIKNDSGRAAYCLLPTNYYLLSRDAAAAAAQSCSVSLSVYKINMAEAGAVYMGLTTCLHLMTAATVLEKRQG